MPAGARGEQVWKAADGRFVMLRSLLDSVRGKPAAGRVLVGGEQATGVVPWVLQEFSTSRTMMVEEEKPAVATVGTVKPLRCCVYCGHGIYVPPKQARTRCPKCQQELPAQDIVLSGEVRQSQIVTAGKIIVEEGAHVEAELVACTIEVRGMVLGNVLASQVCRVKGTGKLAGRILCRELAVEEGAVVEGAVELVRV